MSQDWYPGIRECRTYWKNAAMLQQTFEALEKAFEEQNDACIDCAKSMVEVVCRAIIDELDDPRNPHKPPKEHPSFGDWMTAAVRVLKLGDNRDASFRKLVSQHHSLTSCLGDLRATAGPVSHGKEAFIERLSDHHRRAAVLSADAIVAFLHHAYLGAEVKIGQTKRPYEDFATSHLQIDRWAEMSLDRDESGAHIPTVSIGSEEFPVTIDASAILFHLDRTAYVEAFRAGRDYQAHIDAAFDVIDWEAKLAESSEAAQ